MSGPVVCRPMERTDLTAVLDMLGDLNAAGFAADERYQLQEDWRETMRETIRERWFGVFHPFPPCYVAELEGELVGYVQGDVMPLHPVLEAPPTVRIGNLWVKPGHRRQGIARRLVTTWVNTARQRGFPWVEVGTLAADHRAVAFWQALGFGPWRVTLLNDR